MTRILKASGVCLRCKSVQHPHTCQGRILQPQGSTTTPVLSISLFSLICYLTVVTVWKVISKAKVVTKICVKIMQDGMEYGNHYTLFEVIFWLSDCIMTSKIEETRNNEESECRFSLLPSRKVVFIIIFQLGNINGLFTLPRRCFCTNVATNGKLFRGCHGFKF